MFCLVHNNSVIVGPIDWSKARFETALREELNIECNALPTTNDELIPVVLSEAIKILPVNNVQEPPYNHRIQQLAGPFYTITNNDISYSYEVVDRDIESVKHELFAQLAEQRWKVEVAGITVNIQNTDIFVSTERGQRDAYMQAFLRGTQNIEWKFGSTWLTLSLMDLQTIDIAIYQHVQRVFSWESRKTEEINKCNDLLLLDQIILEYRELTSIE